MIKSACTSPHLILWLGSYNNIVDSKDWANLYEIIINEVLYPLSAVNKLAASGNKNGWNKIETQKDNLIFRLSLEKLYDNIDFFRCGSGC